MMSGLSGLLIYLVPLAVILAIYGGIRLRAERHNRSRLDEAAEAGMTEPSSLHPIIDPARCLGCAACIRACPEGNILGLVNGKVKLVEPTSCIGHGACRAACPLDAITLVFGTEKRGIDIPMVGTDFQTNVPGIYIAGELGGMGLIRNAIEQGRQAMQSVARNRAQNRDQNRAGGRDMLDVVIIGAGPAGFSASLAAMEHRLRAVTLEQDTLGGTVAHFPRGKLVMTQPAILSLYGKMAFSETSKEELMEFWQEVERKTGVEISYQERLDTVVPVDGGFELTTSRRTYRTRNILLTIGRRGTPRKLGVPGEELHKVVYRLIDAEQYRGRHVLVVGGGDSALEAAATLAEEPEVTVTLSYRNDAFGRAKPKNRARIEAAGTDGRLQVLLRSQVRGIGDGTIEIEVDGVLRTLRNDAVIVAVGGILPTGFLNSMGVEVETKHGVA